MVGVLVSLTTALAPFRFPFLEEILLVGAVTLDMLMHSLAFAWYVVWMPMIFTSWRAVSLATVVVFQGGIVIEFLQMHIPNRRFSEEDILANLVGCVCGVVAGVAIRRRWLAARS